MSLFIDLKYINFIASQLRNFKRKDDYLFNFSCPICGDSSTKKTKARGYFYKVKNDMFMKCHNCSASLHFGTFLQKLNLGLHSQYCFERYADSVPANKPYREPKLVFTEPKIETNNVSLIDSLLDRVDTLPEDHIAVKFCKNRLIPESVYKRLYFIECMSDIGQLKPKMREKITTKESRLILPFYDEKYQLTGITCRALGNETLRYVTIEIKENVPLIFGVDVIDTSKHIYVVEGPIDSLFLPNAIAVTGTSFGKLDKLGLDKNNLTVIIDNQPRNKDVCKIIEKMIDKDYSVVIWPQYLEEKDINEMVISGKSVQSIMKIIKERTFRGLEAKANFVTWKRC
jgi:hypothetical protein